MSKVEQELENKLKQTQTKLQKLIQENQKIKNEEKKKITNLNDKISQKLNEIDALKKKHQQLEAETDDLKHLLKQFTTSQNGNLEDKKRIVELEKELTLIKNDLNQKTTKLEQKQRECKRIKDENKLLDNENYEIRNELIVLRRKSRDQSEKIDRIKQDKENEAKERRHYEDEFVKWAKALKQIKKKFKLNVEEPQLEDPADADLLYFSSSNEASDSDETSNCLLSNSTNEQKVSIYVSKSVNPFFIGTS